MLGTMTTEQPWSWPETRADGQPIAGGQVLIHFTMSLDGFVADTEGNLDWAFGFGGPSAAAVQAIIASIGAALAGRRGYDQGMMRGAKLYGGAWSGPQFVLTHRPAEPPADPSVTFLHGSLREAVATARAAAGGKYVVVVGASIARQCLAEGLADEILLHLVPVVLGDGIRLFGGPLPRPVALRPVSVGRSGDVTDLRFSVIR
jgi:dihydrofolate reductase